MKHRQDKPDLLHVIANTAAFSLLFPSPRVASDLNFVGFSPFASFFLFNRILRSEPLAVQPDKSPFHTVCIFPQFARLSPGQWERVNKE